MIAALFALAAAMLVAGITAVIEGFPYVRLESGMAMVYGGSVVASSGVLLGGLGVVVLWLKRVEKALRDGATFGTLAAAVAATPNPDVFPEPDLTVPSYVPPVMGLVPERSRVEPSLGLPQEPQAEPAPVEPQRPIPAFDAPPAPTVEAVKAEAVKAEAPTPEVTKPAEPRDDLFVPGRNEAASEEATPLRSSLDAAPEPAAEVKPERTVVGRYSSGGNTYMMYDNGTIEAETPNGRFTFASLDELKAFVDSGGEGGARGAA